MLNDDERYRDSDRAARQMERKVRARRWRQERSFVALPPVENPTPATPQISQATINYAFGGGDCGPGAWAILNYRSEEITSGTFHAVERKDRGTIAVFRDSEQRKLSASLGEWLVRMAQTLWFEVGFFAVALFVGCLVLLARRGLLAALKTALLVPVVLSLASLHYWGLSGTHTTSFGDTLCVSDKSDLSSDGPSDLRLVSIGPTGETRSSDWVHPFGTFGQALIRLYRQVRYGYTGGPRLEPEQEWLRHVERTDERWFDPPVSTVTISPGGAE